MNLDALKNYLPENALPYLYKWLEGVSLTIKIKNDRKTKLGDYRYDKQSQKHQITINGSLEKEAFFFVITHEIAHLLVQNKYHTAVKSHGIEWKNEFSDLLKETVEIYPENFRAYILKHAVNPKASVGADADLHKLMFLKKEYHENLIENLNEGQKFRIRKRIFIKGKKRKIRYICRDLKTNKSYLVSGMAVADEIYEE